MEELQEQKYLNSQIQSKLMSQYTSNGKFYTQKEYLDNYAKITEISHKQRVIEEQIFKLNKESWQNLKRGTK